MRHDGSFESSHRRLASTIGRSILLVTILMLVLTAGFGPAFAASPDQPMSPKDMFKSEPRPLPVLKVSLNEALALFLKQNLDVIITGFGIETARGQQITARLFPNPVFIFNTQASFTQGFTPGQSGQVTTQIQQLFEMAGKRGYRIESAAFGTQSAEANFEDAIRQLGFTVKDAYYRVQLALR